MATFGTFVSGQVLTAAELNSGGTWQSYTPTWTQSATITKTTDFARYMQFNKFVFGSLKMTASSSGTANNKILVGLPVSASANNFILGETIYDAQGVFGGVTNYARFFMRAVYESSSAMAFYFNLDNDQTNETSTTFRNTRVGTTNTLAGGNNDYSPVVSGNVIYVQFCYEAA